MLIILIIKFILAAISLSVSSILIIKTLIPIGKHLGLNTFTVSFLLMAFATSLPEMSVAIKSAMAATPELAIGAIIGSNIADLTIVAGVLALISKQTNVTGILKKRDASYMTFISIIMLLLIADHTLSRPDGFILLLIYFFYLWNILKQRKYFDNEKHKKNINDFIANIIIFIISLIILMSSANIIVNLSYDLGNALSIPIILIGLFVIAFGTSLPELAFEIQAVKRGKQELAMGDLIGSVVTNSALIIGLTAVISPIHFTSFDLFDTSIIFFMIALFFFNVFMWTKKELSWFEGLLLMAIYTFFLFSETFIGFLES